MTHQHATIGDTVYFWFAANDTSGSGGDGATPLYDVREAGAAAGAAPLLSGTPTLLSHVNYPAGCHEIAVAATVGNGFAANDTFAVFCTLAIDSQNPTGFVGSCTLTPLATQASVDTIDSNVDAILVDTAEIGAAGAGLSAVPWNAAWDAQVQSEVQDAITANFTFTQSGQVDSNVQYWNDTEVTTALETAASIADAVTDEAISGHTTAGTVGAVLNGFTFTQTGVVDANIQYINDAIVTGDGTSGTEWDSGA